MNEKMKNLDLDVLNKLTATDDSYATIIYDGMKKRGLIKDSNLS